MLARSRLTSRSLTRLRHFLLSVLLAVLLPALTRHYPYSLHRAYVAPVNVVFWAIWSVAKALLPAKVTERFTLLSGDDWREKLAEEIGEPEVAERLRAYIDT